MRRIGLDIYDDRPEEMLNYLRHYGYHFNKKALKYALSFMKGKDKKKLTPFTKEQVDDILNRNGVTLDNNILYDYVYVANMCKADYYEGSVPNEAYLAKYIKESIDDVDGYDGIIFNRWYADMTHKGIGIDWEEIL